MKVFFRTLLAVVFLCQGYAAFAQSHFVGSRFFGYDVIANTNMGRIAGRGVLSWQSDGKSYHSSLTVKALFINLLNSASDGRVGSILAPEKYTEKLFRRDAKKLFFDRPAHKIRIEPGAEEIMLRTNEQDNLSIIWQLRARVMEGGGALGTRHDFFMSGPIDVYDLQFKGLGLEKIQAQGNTYLAWHLQRLPIPDPQNAAEAKQFDFWFAPELNYFPVKLRFKDPSQDSLEFVLTKVSETPID